MKKVFGLLLALLLCTVALGALAGGMEYVNNGPDKTVYERPDVTSQVQGTLYNGSHLILLGRQGNWANVAVNNVVTTQTIGWVEATGLALVGEALPGVAVVYNPDPRDRLNLRTAPRASATSLGKYYNGTVVDPLGPVTGGWMKVRIGILQGYMEARYLMMGAQAGDVPSAMPMVTVRNTGGTGLNMRLHQSTTSKLFEVLSQWDKASGDGHHAQLVSRVCRGAGRPNGLYVGPAFKPAAGLSSAICHSPLVTPVPAVPGSGGFDGWNGPVGHHPVIGWPLGGGNATVNNPNPKVLNLRTQPRAGAPTLGKYYSGVRVDVYEAIPGGWSRVSVGGLNGYMQTRYLDFAGSTASAMPLMSVYNPGAARNLHLRSAKSTSSRSRGLYPNGTR